MEPTDPHYADQRVFFGIPNAANSLSALVLPIVGITALLYTLIGPSRALSWRLLLCYSLLFLLTAIWGVAAFYHHLGPNRRRYFHYRWTATCLVLAVFATFVAEIASVVIAVWLLPALLVAGLILNSWAYRTGDDRPYNWFQTSPIAVLVVMPLLFPPSDAQWVAIGWIVVWYGLEKMMQVLDHQVWALSGWVSGQTLKHFFTGAAIALFIPLLQLNL